MNVPSKTSRLASLFRSGRNQAVRIPEDLEFPASVKKVVVKRDGNRLIISPEGGIWDDFFNRPPNPDFPERGRQGEYEERESFDA